MFLSLLNAIFLLNWLPLLGSAWHRVLPEHVHVLIGHVAENMDEPFESQGPLSAGQACAVCAETSVVPGLVHLPDGIALQILALAICLLSVFTLEFDFGRARRVFAPAPVYVPPCLALSDPPPTTF